MVLRAGHVVSQLNVLLNVHFCLSTIRLRKGVLTFYFFEDLFTMSRKPVLSTYVVHCLLFITRAIPLTSK